MSKLVDSILNGRKIEDGSSAIIIDADGNLQVILPAGKEDDPSDIGACICVAIGHRLSNDDEWSKDLLDKFFKEMSKFEEG